MTSAHEKRDPLRYRVYFWMMDASFTGICVFFASVLYQLATGLEGFGLPSTPKAITAIVLIVLILVLPFVLIVFSSLRDEYAELVWRRTVKPLVIIMATTPLLFYVFTILLEGLLADPANVDGLRWLFEEQSFAASVTSAWLLFNMVFVVIFQFLRWRDSK